MKIPRVYLSAVGQCSWPARWPATERDRRPGRRIIVFVLVLLYGVVLNRSGRDLETALVTLVGFGLAGATVARWVADDGPLPSVGALLARGSGGAA